jgi:Putative metal-binding motif/FG-GAP-like repeat/FG-GAP repeat
MTKAYNPDLPSAMPPRHNVSMTLLSLLLPLGCEPAEIKIGDDTGGVVIEEGPHMEVSPTDLAFPVLLAGQSSTMEVTITNTGTIALSPTATIDSAQADAYSLSIDKASLGSAEVATLTVTLSPMTWGNYMGTITVEDTENALSALVAVTALVQEDADGDGFGSIASGGDDCDDADIAVNPGATEVWYDGVDSDCSGGSDFDQDGDGHDDPRGGGNDCDDQDSAVNPDAADTWYDGVDSDCAGNDDYDQDSDGFRAEQGGGDDCDDTDPAIRPDAADTWYDGIDSDCAGNNDYDQDGDGQTSSSYNGTDCDDTNAAVYAGAPEIWYDGVDEDCNGGNDYDQDGDGVNSSLFGGADCNDIDPTVTGPSAEVWDGQDNDCDGMADDFAITDVQGGVVYGNAANTYLGYAGTVALGGDTNADGTQDLVLGAPYQGNGVAWLLSAASVVAANGAVTNYDSADMIDDGYYAAYYDFGWVQGPMADVTGDGSADVLVDSLAGSFSQGFVDAFDGATLSGSWTSSGAFAAFGADNNGSDYTSVGVAADIDGDGIAEVITGNRTDNDRDFNDLDSAGAVAIFTGGSLSDYYGVGDDGLINGDDDYDYFGSSVAAQDLDADGYADLVVGASGVNNGNSRDVGAFYVIPGSSSGFYGSAADYYSLKVSGTTASGALGTTVVSTQGDVDGDGAIDLLLGSTGQGVVWLWWDVASQAGDVDVSSAAASFSGTAGSFASSIAVSDLDGDGADDLLVGDYSNDTASTDAGALWIYAGSSQWSGAATAASAVIWGGASGDYLGSAVAGGYDLNGDGHEDALVGAYGNDGAFSNGGAVYFVSR